LCRWCPISACVHTAHRRIVRIVARRALRYPVVPMTRTVPNVLYWYVNTPKVVTTDYRVRCFSRFSCEQIRVIPPLSRPSCSRLPVRSPVFSPSRVFVSCCAVFSSKNRRRADMEAVKAFTFEVSQTNVHHMCGHLVNSRLLGGNARNDPWLLPCWNGRSILANLKFDIFISFAVSKNWPIKATSAQTRSALSPRAVDRSRRLLILIILSIRLYFVTIIIIAVHTISMVCLGWDWSGSKLY